MSVKILTTGSSGNCVLLHGRILIDAGITRKKFNTFQIDESTIDMVIISHKHKDHANLPFIRYLISQEIQTYLPAEMIGILMNEGKLDIQDYMNRGLVKVIQSEMSIITKDIEITPYPQRHGDIINYAFVLESPGHRMLYSTDLDTLESTEVGLGITSLGHFNTILLEGNYDETWLRDYIQYMVGLVNTQTDPRTMTDEQLDAWVKRHYSQLPQDIARNAFRAIQNRRHLSKQQARAYAATHLLPGGTYYEIHRSSQFYTRPDDWYQE